jgi:hypothetical protein
MTVLDDSMAAADPGAAGLEALRVAISPVREDLLGHPLYGSVNTVPRLRRFMRYHVFAVWDFMCLAKRLQRDLTSLGVLWLPPTQPSLARFINSVVHGEESDVDLEGRAVSHFDLYLSAMDEVGASTAEARGFVATLRVGQDLDAALVAFAPTAQTLYTVEHGSTIEVLSSFLFAREDLIPEMFARILRQWSESAEARRFQYYIERHIELDGDEHGPAGLRALAEMAGADEEAWQAARRAAEAAMASRVSFWDSVNADVLHLDAPV